LSTILKGDWEGEYFEGEFATKKSVCLRRGLAGSPSDEENQQHQARGIRRRHKPLRVNSFRPRRERGGQGARTAKKVPRKKTTASQKRRDALKVVMGKNKRPEQEKTRGRDTGKFRSIKRRVKSRADSSIRKKGDPPRACRSPQKSEGSEKGKRLRRGRKAKKGMLLLGTM